MFSFSMPELMLVLVIALMVFGPGKLPEVGRSIGKGLQEFKRAATVNLNETKEEELKDAQIQEIAKKPGEPKSAN